MRTNYLKSLLVAIVLMVVGCYSQTSNAASHGNTVVYGTAFVGGYSISGTCAGIYDAGATQLTLTPGGSVWIDAPAAATYATAYSGFNGFPQPPGALVVVLRAYDGQTFCGWGSVTFPTTDPVKKYKYLLFWVSPTIPTNGAPVAVKTNYRS